MLQYELNTLPSLSHTKGLRESPKFVDQSVLTKTHTHVHTHMQCGDPYQWEPKATKGIIVITGRGGSIGMRGST